MQTLVLAQQHVAELVRRQGRDELMDRMVARLRRALAEPAVEGSSPARHGFLRDHVGGVIEWMPHRAARHAVTLKTVSYSPLNPQAHGYPTISGVVARFDDGTGRLVAVADAFFLTALRTGAASAVATELLAVPGSSVLGLVGAGAQAVTQAHALSRVLPLRELLVHDVDDVYAKSFGDRVRFLGLPVRVVPLAELEEASDVVCTATSVGVGAGPVLRGTALRGHVHVNAVGADLPGKTELPMSLLRSAFVVPDHVEQARREGECQRLPDRSFELTLSDLCADPVLAHVHREHRTVFDSTGYALEDHVALEVLMEVAREAGVGEHLDLEYRPDDPLDPYAAPAAAVRS